MQLASQPDLIDFKAPTGGVHRQEDVDPISNDRVFDRLGSDANSSVAESRRSGGCDPTHLIAC